MQSAVVKTWFETLAECMGVKLVKKYWVIGGSYWNKTHINPTNSCDLTRVINDADSYTATHRTGMAFELLTFAAVYVCGFTIREPDLTAYMKLLAILACYHSYAFMLHTYNRVKARAVLGSLKKDDECVLDLLPRSMSLYVPSVKPDPLEDTPYKIPARYDRAPMYGNDDNDPTSCTLCLRDNTCVQIGPVFINEDAAIKFANAISKYPVQTVLNAHFYGRDFFSTYLPATQ